MMTASGPSIAGAVVLGGNYGSLAVIRSLGRRGIPVAFMGQRFAVAASSRYVTHFEPWAGVAEKNPIGHVLDFVARHDLMDWVLFPGADYEVQLVAEHQAELAPHLALLTMDWPALQSLNDKGQLYALADRLGVDFPRVYDTMAAPEALSYPVVVKPSSTQSINALTRDKAWRADNAADFSAKQGDALRLMGPDGFVVQQLIPGDGSTQYSYAGLWENGREVCQLTALRLRQFPIQFGTSPYVQSRELPRATEEARRLLAAVQYHGLVEVEFKHDQRDDRLKLLDVNTRIWAWIGLGEATGVDFPYLAAALASGLPPASPVPVYGTAWRRAIPNLLASLRGLMQGQPGLMAGRSIFGAAHPAVFARDDIMPALGEIPGQVLRKLRGRRSQ